MLSPVQWNFGGQQPTNRSQLILAGHFVCIIDLYLLSINPWQCRHRNAPSDLSKNVGNNPLQLQGWGHCPYSSINLSISTMDCWQEHHTYSPNWFSTPTVLMSLMRKKIILVKSNRRKSPFLKLAMWEKFRTALVWPSSRAC